MITNLRHKDIIFFDGVCNLCNASINYIIRHDKENRYVFSSLQSEFAKKTLKEFPVNNEDLESIVLLTSEKKLFSKSTAALKIASQLGFPRNLLSGFLIIPNVIRNWVYDFIAKNRYKWFGKLDVCMIPTPELQEKFIDNSQ